MSLSEKRNKAQKIFKKLESLYPDAHCELNYSNAYELLIATILSAQCTDVKVNQVTKILFLSYPTPKQLAQANPEEVESIIYATGFYKNKTKNIIECARQLTDEHNEVVPQDMDQLTSLAGVGRKTANVVLGNVFNINEGIVVDTHVKRITNLLGLTKHEDPVKIEADLVKLFPQKQWTMLSHLLIFHGRRTCVARRPNCSDCPLASLCLNS